MSAEGSEIRSEKEETSDITDTETLKDVEVHRPGSQEASNVPLFAWSSIIKTLADAEPVAAAGIVGVVVILVLWVFGRVGSLIVGVLGGVLLHASLDKRRDVVTGLHNFLRDTPPEEVKIEREVIHVSGFTNF
jgi:hypothetical protein